MADTKISDLTAATSVASADLVAIVQGGTTKKATAGLILASNGVKVYRAVLTQAGTDNPTAVVLENSLGGSVAWVRDGQGAYSGSLLSAFQAGKTFLSYEAYSWNVDSFSAQIAMLRVSNDSVQIRTADGASDADGILSDTCIGILTYP